MKIVIPDDYRWSISSRVSADPPSRHPYREPAATWLRW
jgi:hypothetical protein